MARSKLSREKKPVQWLERELRERQKRNPAYSLRAYARDLGVSASRLSEVLAGRGGLSVATAERIAPRLTPHAREQRHFIDLAIVAAQPAGSLSARLARRRIDEYVDGVLEPVSLSRFRHVCDWRCFALLELTKVADFRADFAWMAKELHCDVDTVISVVARLEEAGLLQVKGNSILLSHGNHEVNPRVPSEVVRAYHRQVLEKSAEAIERVPMGKRNLGSVVLAFRAEDYDEAVRRIELFRHDFDKDFGRQSDADDVYFLAIQFFPVRTR